MYLCTFINEFDMGIIPDRYLKELFKGTKHTGDQAKPMNGWMALSPLVVFLCVYLLSSIIAQDFYKIPISAAFLIASVYAIAICRGKTMEERIATFSEGAGNKNVLLMIWIFVLAGAFAATAKEIGAIDATVNLALRILPGKLLYAGLFLAACFISMSIGTSVGTIVALVPVAAGIAEELALGGASGSFVSTPFITAIIVGGAFFGDNLSFISDTTIAATRTQGCAMKDKFRENFHIALPAALATLVLIVALSLNTDIKPTAIPDYDLVMVIPYLLVLAGGIIGINVFVVLMVGIVSGVVILLATGAHPRTVGFKGEAQYKGRGVAYCATCDGEFFTGKEIFVVGGGYAAAEESVFLTKFARHVTILVRKDDFSCAASVADQAKNHEKITVLTNTVMEEVALSASS